MNILNMLRPYPSATNTRPPDKAPGEKKHKKKGKRG